MLSVTRCDSRLTTVAALTCLQAEVCVHSRVNFGILTATEGFRAHDSEADIPGMNPQCGLVNR